MLFKKVILIVCALHILLAVLNAQYLGSRDLLVGTWVASSVESGHSCVITYQFNENGTTQGSFSCDNGTYKEDFSGTASYNSESGVLKDVTNGRTSVGIIKFFDKNYMVCTIINNGNPSSRGHERHYKRIEPKKIKSGWTPLVDWGKSLFPSYIISTANANLPIPQNSPLYLGDMTSVLGIKIVSPEDNAKVNIEIIDAEGKYFERVNSVFILPKRGEVYAIYPTVLWHYDVLRKQTQTTPLGITFKVKIEGKTEEQVLNAQMHSINDCPLTVKDYNDETVSVQYICAAYVNEEHPEIEKITKEALDSKIIDNIPIAESEEETTLLVSAIWRALQGRGIKYSNGAVEESNSNFFCQRIRLFDDAINTAQANCIDGVVLFASILRKVGVDPIVVIIPGHSLLAYYTTKGENRQVKFLETTMLGSIDLTEYSTPEAKNKYSKLSFIEATQVAKQKYDKAIETTPKGVQMIDITKARSFIKPLGRN